jgi:hypothetical protein
MSWANVASQSLESVGVDADGNTDEKARRQTTSQAALGSHSGALACVVGLRPWSYNNPCRRPHQLKYAARCASRTIAGP